MYKNIELLQKGLSALKFKEEYNFNHKLIPITLTEFTNYNLPIIISGGKKQEFLLMSALPWQDSIFYKKDCSILKEPLIYQMYPFIYVNAKEEGSDKLVKALAVDKNGLNENYDISIFEDNDLSKKTKQKANAAKKFGQLKEIEEKIIQTLKKFEILETKEFDVKIEGKEPKSILKDFFVVNLEKLYNNLPQKILNEWKRNDWLFFIEYHVHSIKNIENLFLRDLKK